MFENDLQLIDYNNEEQLMRGERTPLGLAQVLSIACRANLRAGHLPTAALCMQLAEEALAAESKKGKKGNQHAGGGTPCERDVLLTRGLLLVAREDDAQAASVFRKLLQSDSSNLIAAGYLRLLERRNARS